MPATCRVLAILMALPGSLALAAPRVGLYRADPGRTSQAQGGVPFVDLNWWLSSQWVAEANEPSSPERVTVVLKTAQKAVQARHQPLLVSSFPITAFGMDRRKEKVPLVVFRGHGGIHAVNVRNGKSQWQARSDWSLDDMLSNDQGGLSQRSVALNAWLEFYIEQGQRPEIVFENSVVGSLSADRSFVYAVEDLAVPPPGHLVKAPPDRSDYVEELNTAIKHNELEAHNLARDGALEWKLGSKEGEELADSYFLGPPLPLDGKIYILVEKLQDLRLVCIDPTVPNPRPNRQGRLPMTAKILWSQSLDAASQKLSLDVTRRTTAAHLSYADGILVCPTHDGRVIGMDLVKRRLAWKYTYAGKQRAITDTGGHRDVDPFALRHTDPAKPRAAGTSFASWWKWPTAVVQDGKVIFTAADSPDVHCLGLNDGARLWARARQDDDLYLAGAHADRVLLVTRKGVRALRLSTGEPLWSLNVGVPSGQGVFVGGDYYLPVERGGIAIVDVAKGRMCCFVPLLGPRDQPAEGPSNLLFADGHLFVQSLLEVRAYPLAADRMAEIERKLARSPNDASALMDRALARLAEGKPSEGVADLLRALEQKPSDPLASRINTVLYSTLTDLLRSDFSHAKPYLKVYRELCDQAPPEVDDEKEQRNARHRRLLKYLLLVAQGQESQGELGEAVKHYLELAETAVPAELMDDPEGPGRLFHPWLGARQHIQQMLERAAPRQRLEMEEKILHWLHDGMSDDVRAHRRLAAVAPSLPLGWDVRLKLARRLQKTSPLEADLLLQQVRRHGDSDRAAAAVHQLAELMLAHGRLVDAVSYYRILSRGYAQARLAGGKSGAEVWQEVSNDPRLQPYLAEPPGFTGEPKFQVEQRRAARLPSIWLFTPHGEVLPSLRNRDVGISSSGATQEVLVRDRASGARVWHASLEGVPRYDTEPFLDIGRPIYSYQCLGTLMLLLMRKRVVAVDTLRQRVVWHKELLVPESSKPREESFPTVRATLADRRDSWLWLEYGDGWMQQMGQPLVLSPSVICLRTREGLLGIDPLTGQTLWKRPGVPAYAALFGNADTVCLAEMDDSRIKAVQVFRTSDGSRLTTSNSAALAGSSPLRALGSRLLVMHTPKGDKVTLRLHDAPGGKDVWQQSYPPQTKVSSTIDEFVAVLSAKGDLSVLATATGKEVFRGRLDRIDHPERVVSISLLADEQHFYLICHRAPYPEIQEETRSILERGSGLCSLPLYGELYALKRSEQGLAWWTETNRQRLILNHFAEMPLLLLTYRAGTEKNRFDLRPHIAVLEKHSGRCRAKLELQGQGHTLLVNPKEGKIVLLAE